MDREWKALPKVSARFGLRTLIAIESRSHVQAGTTGDFTSNWAVNLSRGGNITIEVDGQTYAMAVWASGGAINTESNVGADNFEAIWSMVAAGQRLSVTDSAGQHANLNLSGIDQFLRPEPCLGVGNSW